MEKMEIYNQVRNVPEKAKKTITGGRLNGFTDIKPMWRIEKLTELFGPCGIGWTYEIDRQWLEKCGDEVAAFCNIRLRVKVDEEWSMSIPGTGGSTFAARERSGIRMSDECYKMALTDALSVACKNLGIGSDVYWGDDRTKYTRPTEAEKEPQKATVAQINTIKGLCDKHNINYGKLLEMNHATEPDMTAAMAGKILAMIKRGTREKDGSEGENSGHSEGLENR